MLIYIQTSIILKCLSIMYLVLSETPIGQSLSPEWVLMHVTCERYCWILCSRSLGISTRQGRLCLSPASRTSCWWYLAWVRGLFCSSRSFSSCGHKQTSQVVNISAGTRWQAHHFLLKQEVRVTNSYFTTMEIDLLLKTVSGISSRTHSKAALQRMVVHSSCHLRNMKTRSS